MADSRPSYRRPRHHIAEELSRPDGGTIHFQRVTLVKHLADVTIVQNLLIHRESPVAS